MSDHKSTESKKRTYSISELAAEFDITTRTIRFYEEKGLLNPNRNGQNRIYTPADRTKLRLILRGKRLGLSLEESRDIIDMYAADRDNSDQLQTLINKIREKRAQLQHQLFDIETMIQDLNEAENNLIEAMAKHDQKPTLTEKR
ncbi:MerR family DNA-binding transcriptional regulator [Spongiibacter sp. KMU-158]|uniref:MerR family DNA-binding transcriptional regulator n=1 Tax=Spongiibacter pelagi TaxID=2760804 RepID=A0A927GXN6_9GAMM|nr:MerR family DNA-binding transcriptional regulator [Spongiibacter pelagi]